VTDVAAATTRIWTREATALARLGACGLALLLITGLMLRLDDIIDWNLIVLLLLVSGAITVAATRAAAQAPVGLGLTIVLLGALALRLLVLTQDPLFSDDIYRYVWDGMVQGAGINPYRFVPADPALASLRDVVIFPNINRADYATTIYPPVAQAFFFAITRVGASVTAMRLALIGCEIVTLVVLIDLLRSLGRPVTLATAYAWHPLAVWEIANNGHVDALMTTLVMIGTWLAARHRKIPAGIAMTLSALVKPYAVAALAACWRPWDWRLPLVVIAVVVACYLPYLGASQSVLGFLVGGYLHEEGFQSGDGFWLVHAARVLLGDVPGLLTLYLALAAATLGTLTLRIAFKTDDSPQRTTRDIATLLLAGLFFLSPNYPWYFLVVVPFISIGGGAPAWTLSLGAFLLYLTYPDYASRFLIWKGVISGTFLVAVLVTFFRTDIFGRPQGAPRWTR
jgi:alpha-1,6-mannosyltransferase